MLRERREANPAGAAAEAEAGIANADDSGLLNIPRPDPLPLDPRKRWRHMYDGTLPPRPRDSSSNTSEYANVLDSSESGSESDFDNRYESIEWALVAPWIFAGFSL
jgi:hypothetical protein